MESAWNAHHQELNKKEEKTMNQDKGYQLSKIWRDLFAWDEVDLYMCPPFPSLFVASFSPSLHLTYK